MSEYGQNGTWQYFPGPLELIDAGAGPEEVEQQGFVAPSMKSPDRSRAIQSRRPKRTWAWLRGFRAEEVVLDRLPVWVPLAEIWPVPGGTVAFSYEMGSSELGGADLSVFALGGFGGASRRTLTDSVHLSARAVGIAYDTRAFVSATRYRNWYTEEEILRVDVDCSGEYGEYRTRDLQSENQPFQGQQITVNSFPNGYQLIRIEHNSQSTSESQVDWAEASVRTWTFDIGPKLPVVGSPVKFKAETENSQTFRTSFKLPGGYDYAFCSKDSENPIIPICVPLLRTSGEDDVPLV